MKPYTLLLILLSAFYGSFAGEIQVRAINNNSLPPIFYKKLSGKIGDYRIVMDLKRKDTVLSGKYYYIRVGKPINISGSISANGKFMLKELNEKYEVSGIFEGRFDTEQAISGTWTNTKSNKSLPLTLTEENDQGVKILFESRNSQNCRNAERNRNKLSSESSYWDTLCTTLEAEVIQIKAPSASASQKINKKLMEGYCGFANTGKICSSLNDIMTAVNNVGEDDGFNLSIYSDVINNENNILTIGISQSVYYFHAAHPLSEFKYQNFDIRTGNLITLDELFLPGYKPKLSRIAESKFIATNGKEGWDFQRGKFPLNNNFAITSGGLLFQYNPYEIGPYVMGAPEVFIPFKDIKELMKLRK